MVTILNAWKTNENWFVIFIAATGPGRAHFLMVKSWQSPGGRGWQSVGFFVDQTDFLIIITYTNRQCGDFIL